MEPGRTYAGPRPIVKFEAQRANQAFDEVGNLLPIPVHYDLATDLFVKRGVTELLTLEGKLYSAPVKKDGLSPTTHGNLELGARWTAYNGTKGAASFYKGLTLPVTAPSRPSARNARQPFFGDFAV